MGGNLGEGKAERGSAGRMRVTPPRRGTDLPGARIPGAAAHGQERAVKDASANICGAGRTWEKRQEGQQAARLVATGRGKPLGVKAQGRYRHETRPERLRVEQGVKRLRKPEDAAQPGQASPVWVATCFRKRRRVTNPMEGRLRFRQALRCFDGRGQSVRVKL
jgi:hypothetical protein